MGCNSSLGASQSLLLSLAQISLLLHTTQQQVAWCSSLHLGGSSEGIEFLVVPLSSSDGSSAGIGELGLVLGAEEVGDGVSVLVCVQWDDSVDA